MAGVTCLPVAAEPLWVCGSLKRGEVLPLDLMPRYLGGPITVDMSQMVQDPNDPMPRGGTYVHGGDVSNLATPLDTVFRVTWFDAACDSIVVDGQPLDANAIPPGLRLTHSGPSMLLLSGDGYGVVLRGVPLTLWADGAAAQIHGTAGSDTLAGTEGGDVLVPGGSHDLVKIGEGVEPGRDLVKPGAGDDRIIYTGGKTVIGNTPPDTGTDSLDLRRFAAADLAFRADGDDLVIQTGDGSIRLEGQLTEAGNVETLLLAKEKTITAAELRAMALR